MERTARCIRNYILEISLQQRELRKTTKNILEHFMRYVIDNSSRIQSKAIVPGNTFLTSY